MWSFIINLGVFYGYGGRDRGGAPPPHINMYCFYPNLEKSNYQY